MGNFKSNLDMGRIWEERVSIWLQENQHYVFNAYEYNSTTKGIQKAPKLQTLPIEKSLIVPDLLAAQSGITHWIEVKSKNSCGLPFPHNPSYRTTGIDLKYWDDYLKVQDESGIEVHLFFCAFT